MPVHSRISLTRTFSRQQNHHQHHLHVYHHLYSNACIFIVHFILLCFSLSCLSVCGASVSIGYSTVTIGGCDSVSTPYEFTPIFPTTRTCFGPLRFTSPKSLLEHVTLSFQLQCSDDGRSWTADIYEANSCPLSFNSRQFHGSVSGPTTSCEPNVDLTFPYVSGNVTTSFNLSLTLRVHCSQAPAYTQTWYPNVGCVGAPIQTSVGYGGGSFRISESVHDLFTGVPTACEKVFCSDPAFPAVSTASGPWSAFLKLAPCTHAGGYIALSGGCASVTVAGQPYSTTVSCNFLNGTAVAPPSNISTASVTAFTAASCSGAAVSNRTFPISSAATCFTDPRSRSGSYAINCSDDSANATWTLTAFNDVQCSRSHQITSLTRNGTACTAMQVNEDKLYFQVNCGGRWISPPNVSVSITTTTTPAPTTIHTSTTTTRSTLTTTTTKSTIPPAVPVVFTRASLLSPFHAGSVFTLSFSGHGASSCVSLCLKRVTNVSASVCDVLITDQLALVNGSGKYAGELPNNVRTGVYFVVLGVNLTAGIIGTNMQTKPWFLDTLVSIEATQSSTTTKPCICPSQPADCTVSAQPSNSQKFEETKLIGMAVGVAVFIGMGIRWWEWIARI